MDILCPHCKHLIHLKVDLNVKPENEQEVKGNRTPVITDPLTGESIHSVAAPIDTDVKEVLKVEASVAKVSLSQGLTKQQVKEVRRLYEKGFALSRIRHELGLTCTLGRLQTTVSKPW